jgi:predicted small lipoprotein YifL
MISVVIDTCGKCGHLYFPGEDLFSDVLFGVICGDCEIASSEEKDLSRL